MHEPTGWKVECDGPGCGAWSVEFDAYDHSEWHVLEVVHRDGWIVTVDSFRQYCSLDCLLRSRQSKSVRESHAREAKEHVADHRYHCCRIHDTHAVTGRHSWRDCPVSSLRGLKVVT